MEYKLNIIQDLDPLNPREEYDNLGKMICFHRRYNLGDNHDIKQNGLASWDDLKRKIEKEYNPAVILPLFLFDHSGITISVGAESFFQQDPQGWDWGQIGFIFVPKEDVYNEYSVKRISPELNDKVSKVLQGEVENYDYFLRGEMYGFEILDEDDETVESCYGYFGEDEAKKCGEDYLKSFIASENEGVSSQS